MTRIFRPGGICSFLVARLLPAVLLAATAVPQAAACEACSPSDERGRPAATAVQRFPLSAVRLLDGPFLHATELNRSWLLGMDPDRLLAWYRREAGLEPKAAAYGGWERQGVAGHSLGHYLSACAQMYQTTGDAAFRERVDYIVAELAECQQALGTGYIAAIPDGKRVFEEVARGDIRTAGFDLNGVWVPIYTLHKVFAGLRDAYRLCGNEEALTVAVALADWLEGVFAGLSDEQMEEVLHCEHGGINEVLADLYADTGEARYLALSRRFHHRRVLDPLSRGVDNLAGLHANTQVPKLIGLARRYELTGDETDRRTAEFFWKRVVNHHSYVTGGHCINEYFGPPDRLNDRLGPNTTETCNIYNMLKLTEHLFTWEAEAAVGDFYERALFNHILASHHPEDGRVIYNLSLEMGGHKVYQTHYTHFTCCVGTGMENHSRYGAAIYFRGDDRLLVNLFIASELTWDEKGLVLTQETQFPDEDTTRLTFSLAEPAAMTLAVRHPYWAEEGAAVKVNGEPVAVDSEPSSFIEITRTWEDGDRVEVVLPRTLRTEAMPDNPRRIAVMYGPLVLGGDLGPVEDPRAEEFSFVPAHAAPVLVTEGRPPAEWLVPVAERPTAFAMRGVGRPHDVTLEPFFRIHDRRQTVYWDVASAAEWEAHHDAEAQRRREWEAQTVDFFRPGEMQPERDHNLQGERTSAGEFRGRRWRHATDGGWFSFEMAVLPDAPMTLLCTFWGSDANNRVFDVLVDGEKVATMRLEHNRPGVFFDEPFPIPEDLTRGKDRVTVRLQAHPGAWAGGLFGARMFLAMEDEEQAEEAEAAEPAAQRTVEGYPIASVPFTAVTAADGFWAPRLATNREATIPHCFEQCEETHRIANFAIAGGLQKGKYEGLFFNDSDVYKTIEGAAYSLMVHPDAELEAYLDVLIEKIAAAQEEDGYLFTARTLAGDDYMPPGGIERWSDMAMGHELYCKGHLFEAAAAHYEATGKRALLDVALQAADLVASVFHEEGRRDPPGHQEIELGLVRLYQVTGDENHLDQARFFLEQRGRPHDRRFYGTYSQDHQPVAEQTEAVGHAVRAAYMYASMADIAAYLGESAYFKALERLWDDVVGTKLYITGGLGAAGGHEGFGEPYDLPNRVAYCETCAGIANVFWNQRMFQLTGEGRYVDALERSLYNNVLSGVSLEGGEFFYPNPLESHGEHGRSEWFYCACCPPNVARFIPQVPGYAYAGSEDTLFVNLFFAGEASVPLGEQVVGIEQQTRYPWEGRVRITVTPETVGETFALAVRIPGWSRGEAVPSDLYRFAEAGGEQPALRLNGEPLDVDVEAGYATIRRPWEAGDRVELELPMPVRRVLSHEAVEENLGKLALQRGPIVYCIEWPDVPEGQVVNLLVPDDAALSAEFEPELLGGVVVLRGEAVSLARTVEGDLTRTPVAFTAIPYYAWAHRGHGEMATWIARSEEGARPLPAPTIASRARPSASGGDARALNDQREPRNSGDHANRFLHWWPRKRTKEWVQYDFAERERVGAVEVYWFDDTGRGECRLPVSWELFYREGGEWKPVPNPSGFGTEADRYNRTTFDPVETDGLRIEVQLQERWSAGIHEWRVEAAE